MPFYSTPKGNSPVLSGAGAPASGLGNVGDIYIDTTNKSLYGPKTAIGWGSGTSLQGPTGATGATGETGPAGSGAATTNASLLTSGTLADARLSSNVVLVDGSGKVPSSSLPSYVDDVVEYANLAALPATGESGKIYVTLDTNKVYRWSGSSYIEVSPTAAHAASHASGGSDAVTLAVSQVTGLQTALAGKAAESHVHAGSDITSGTIDIARLPGNIVRVVTGAISNGQSTDSCNISAVTSINGTLYVDQTLTADYVTSMGGINCQSGYYTASVISSQYSSEEPPTLIKFFRDGQIFFTVKADGSVSTDGTLTAAGLSAPHQHGNITSAGAIGTTSGRIVVTTTGGVLTTSATVSASSVSGLASIATSGSASDLSAGTVPTARLASGTASASTYLRGDQTWSTLAHSDVGNSPSTLTQFTAAQNNLSLGTGGIVRISSSAAVNITGFAAASGGDARMLSNVGSFEITLKHSDAASTAANRILCVGNADFVIAAGGSAVIYYDETASRWRVG